MGEVKWIKIVTNIFDNKKIRIIETMPDGDSLIVIWLKLLILAGNVNDGGYVYFTEDIPYTDQMLATLFNRPMATIQLALKTFEEFGMIEVFNDIIHVSNWERYQNVEGMERIREQTRVRVARHREKKKLECNVTRSVTVTDSNATDIEEDKEKDINISSSKEKELLNQIVDYLNTQTGKSFKASSKATQKHILARINEGYSLEDFKAVIDIKVKQWLGDSKMNMYLRPETLFAGHFEGYLNEAPKKKVVEKPKNTNLEKVVDCPWDDPTPEQEAAFDADREAHKYEDGWLINDDGYWINPEKGIV